MPLESLSLRFVTAHNYKIEYVTGEGVPVLDKRNQIAFLTLQRFFVHLACGPIGQNIWITRNYDEISQEIHTGYGKLLSATSTWGRIRFIDSEYINTGIRRLCGSEYIPSLLFFTVDLEATELSFEYDTEDSAIIIPEEAGSPDISLLL